MSLNKKLIYIILFHWVIKLSLLTGLCYSVFDYEKSYLSPDSSHYLKLAEGIKDDFIFANKKTFETYRTPGYPFFIACCKFLSEKNDVIIIIQILITGIISILIFQISSLFFTEKSALLAVFIYALDPVSNLYALKIMPETLFTCLLLCFFYFLLKGTNKNNVLYESIAGVFLALSVFVRPISLYLIFFILIAYGIVFLRKLKIQKIILKKICFLTSIFYFLIFPWFLRNYLVAGIFVISTVGVTDFYFYRAAAVEAKVNRCDYYKMKSNMEISQNLFPKKNLTKDAFIIILKHPLIYAQIFIKGFTRLFFDPGSVEFLKFFNLYDEGEGLLGKMVDKTFIDFCMDLKVNYSNLFFLTIILLPYPIFIMFFMFLNLSFSSIKHHWLFFIVILYFLLISSGPETTARFRIPFTPLIMIIVADNISKKINFAKKHINEVVSH